MSACGGPEPSRGEASIVRGRESRMEACVFSPCTLDEPEFLESPAQPGPETNW